MRILSARALRVARAASGGGALERGVQHVARRLDESNVELLPRRNEKDLVDVPDEVRQQLDIRFVETTRDVLDAALERAAA